MKSEYEIPPVNRADYSWKAIHYRQGCLCLFMHKETLDFVGFMFLYPLNFIFLIIKLQLFQTALSPGHSEVVCLYSHLLYINTCSEWSVMKMWFLFWAAWIDGLCCMQKWQVNEAEFKGIGMLESWIG